MTTSSNPPVKEESVGKRDNGADVSGEGQLRQLTFNQDGRSCTAVIGKSIPTGLQILE